MYGASVPAKGTSCALQGFMGTHAAVVRAHTGMLKGRSCSLSHPAWC